MKLKLIALAAAALVSGGANAALVTATANTNEMFLNVWNAAGSYTKDLGITFAQLATANPVTLAVSLSDAAFTAFIANGSTYSWDIVGANTVGNYSTLTTLNGAKPAVAPTKSFVQPESSGINNFALGIDSTIAGGNAPGFVVGGTTALYTAGNSAPTYAGTGAVSDTAYTSYVDFGDQTNNSALTGLSFLKLVSGSTGLGTVVSTQTVYSTNTAYLSANASGAYTLNVAAVAAVPEPESLAMLLAGLGMISTVVARRSRKV